MGRTQVRELCSPLLTLGLVAQTLQVSVVTVRRLIARRALASHKIGGQVRVSIRDLDAYLAKTRINPVGENTK